jgi:hypothetical protein
MAHASASREPRRGLHEDDEERGRGLEERHLVRRLTRDDRTKKPFLVLGVSIVTLVIAVVIVLKMIGPSNKDEVMALIAEGEQLARLNNMEGALAKAQRALDIARERSSEYHMAKQLVDRIKTDKVVGETQIDVREENNYFFTNLQPFYERYIDDKSSKFEGRDYLNDPTTARYFVEYRLDYYMERFPNGANAGTVKAWAESLKRRYNEADPFPSADKWWDTEVIATMESKLEHYGIAWKLRSQFRDRNPSYENIKDVEAEIADERRMGENTTKQYIEKIEDVIRSKNYSSAVGRAIKYCENMAGMPDLVARIKAVGRQAVDASAAAGLPFDSKVIQQLDRAGETDPGS